MEIVHDVKRLREYMEMAVTVSGKNSILIDWYLRHAIEVDVDAICDGNEVYIAGIMEHIEEAGIHSGDSACSLPPHSLSNQIIKKLRKQTEALALGLNIIGLMNIQFAIQNNIIFVLEVNPRASRTVPFVAKATGVPIAKIAARVMAGEKLANFNLPKNLKPNHVAVKEAVFPFSRFPGVDTILGPEMKSTGEVMGIDLDFPRAFAKSQLGAGMILPLEGTIFISVKDSDKKIAREITSELLELGFKILATGGTAKFFIEAGIKVRVVNKVLQGRPHCVDAIISGEVQMIINTTDGAEAIGDSFSIRNSSLLNNVPQYTTIAGARAAISAIKILKINQSENVHGLEVRPLQFYINASS
jgi:carbamoyl-phosphate synthase large subunit